MAWRHIYPGSIRDVVVARSDDQGATWGEPVRMHDADEPRSRLQLDRDRKRREFVRECLPGSRRIADVPATTVHRVVRRIHVAARPADRHILVIAAHGVEPRLAKPFQRKVRFRSTVDKIANAEQPIASRIEFNAIEVRLQAAEHAVNVTDDQITSDSVAGEVLEHGECREMSADK